MLKRTFVNLLLVFAVLLSLVSAASAAPPAQEEQTYTVKLGDNLWTLAEKYLGSGPAYWAIVGATTAKYGEDASFAHIADPNLIHPGWKLLIPSAEEAEKYIAVAKAAPPPTRTQLIIALAEEPDILDAQQANWTMGVHVWISQPLVTFDMQLANLVPDWAESWEVSADGKVVTFHLPEGYKYWNDTPLDAQAQADAWWRYKNVSVYAEDLEPIVETNVIDETTLEVVHSDPPAFMWFVLATEYGAPWDAAEAEKIGDEQFGRTPVASGPFKLKEWAGGSHILLERNDNYRTHLPFIENQGPPLLDEVLLRFIPEGLTRVSELEAGTVDMLFDIPPSEVARLQEHPDIQVLESPNPGLTYLNFNNQNPPFDDVRVRGAIASAVNRADLVTTLDETVDPQYAFLAPAQICYTEEMQQYAKDLHSYDVEAAKALLAEAGWTDTDGDGIVDKDGEPFSVDLLVPTDDPLRGEIGVVVQAQLQAIGLDVSIATYESMYIRDLCVEDDFADLALNQVGWNDPDILLYYFTDQGRNYPNYQNPEIEEKLMEARYIMDLEERTALYSEIQKTLIDDVAYVPLFSRKSYVAVRTYVKDIVFHRLLAGQLYLNDVTIQGE